MVTDISSYHFRSRILLSLVLALVSFLTFEVNAAKKGVPLVVTDIVKTAVVIEEIPLSGTVSSPQLANLSSEVSGLIKQVLVDAGSPVNVGDILVTLNTDLEELELKATRAMTARAREELSDAKRRLTDARQLAKKKTISDNELQSLKAEVNIASTSLQRFVAEQALQEARLQRHNIRAPFTGVITRKYVASGEWVQPGTEIVQLVATNKLLIDFQVPQRVYPRIDETSSMSLRIEALPEEELTAEIQTLVPFSDASARTMLIRTRLVDNNHNIVPGMSASAILKLKGNPNGIVVSRDAILRYPDGRITAWVISEEGEKSLVEERPVKTGLSFNGQIEILDGLKPGEHVVVEGNESLKNHQSVRILPRH